MPVTVGHRRTPGRLPALRAELRRLADPRQAKNLQWFFKTAPGEYGEGDAFLGLRVPDLRRLSRAHRDLPLAAVRSLLGSRFHEERMLALFILVLGYGRADEAGRETIFRLYLRALEAGRINNWDLVDCSAPYIVGRHLLDRDRRLLYRLAKSGSLWERRVAVLATFWFIREGQFAESLCLARLLLSDREDLIHKATGWMLREVGKRDPEAAAGFLRKHCRTMPRTMLRYAIERLPAAGRRMYLAGRV
ncbi:MAG TPA: DNA alkylation repair protein [Planctomycetota bacterium]|nr:DNA alkylation repair protein [Planctomycetota bacterium]